LYLLVSILIDEVQQFCGLVNINLVVILNLILKVEIEIKKCEYYYYIK